MPFVEANGGRFFYEDDDFTDPWLESDVVWIQHGVGRSGRFWQHWVPPLAQNYRVVRRDQRGHGRSPAAEADFKWSMAGLLDDMAAFLDALEIDSVHYIGESMGAVLGLAFAARWPNRLKSLTLSSMPVDLRPPRNKALNAGYVDSSEAKRDLGSDGWARAMIKSNVISGGTSAAHERWVIEEIGKMSVEALIGIGLPLYSPEADVAELLDDVSVPTLVIAPTNSPIILLEDQVRLRDSLPNGQIVIVDGPTHEVYVDRPNECIEAWAGFVRSISSENLEMSCSERR